MTNKNTLNEIIDDFSSPSLEEKEYVSDIIKKQIVESKREGILKRAKSAENNFKKGKVKKGAVNDLYRDLEND